MLGNRLQALQIGGNGDTRFYHYCYICNTQLNSCKQALLHCSGKRHRKKLQFIQSRKTGVGPGSSNPATHLAPNGTHSSASVISSDAVGGLPGSSTFVFPIHPSMTGFSGNYATMNYPPTIYENTMLAPVMPPPAGAAASANPLYQPSCMPCPPPQSINNLSTTEWYQQTSASTIVYRPQGTGLSNMPPIAGQEQHGVVSSQTPQIGSHFYQPHAPYCSPVGYSPIRPSTCARGMAPRDGQDRNAPYVADGTTDSTSNSGYFSNGPASRVMSPSGTSSISSGSISIKSVYQCNVCSRQYYTEKLLQSHQRSCKVPPEQRANGNLPIPDVSNPSSVSEDVSASSKDICSTHSNGSCSSSPNYCSLCNGTAGARNQQARYGTGTSKYKTRPDGSSTKSNGIKSRSSSTSSDPPTEITADSDYFSGSGDAPPKGIICISNPSNDRPTAKFHCQLCNIFLNSPAQAKQHIASQRHQTRATGRPPSLRRRPFGSYRKRQQTTSGVVASREAVEPSSSSNPQSAPTSPTPDSTEEDLTPEPLSCQDTEATVTDTAIS